jgi:class 3 adenylate cyclase
MVGRNFTGKGVHEASRIGGLAEGNQIVASAETAAGGAFPTTDPRTVTVKGISDPIEVVTVDWR